MYEYRGKITRVVDGDTMDFLVDLGFKISIIIRLRILGIDTPELRGHTEHEQEHAGAAKARAIELLEGKDLVIETERVTEKYGRYLAKITLQDGRDFSEVMTNEGYQKSIYID